MLHVTRPRVSDVVNRKVEKFTIDALVGMLARIGKQVRLGCAVNSLIAMRKLAMGFHFRRRIKLLPGIRVNVSRSGVSTIPRRG